MTEENATEEVESGEFLTISDMIRIMKLVRPYMADESEMGLHQFYEDHLSIFLDINAVVDEETISALEEYGIAIVMDENMGPYIDIDLTNVEEK